MISIFSKNTAAPQKMLCRWPRALARLLDLAWELVLVIPLLFWFAEDLRPENISSNLWLLAITFIAVPFALLLDAFVAAVFGNTPVKALVGINPKTIGMERLSLVQHVQRNFGVWTDGMAIGILPLTVLSGRTQFMRINGRRSATYDQRLGVHVHASPYSGLRISALLATVLAPFLIASTYFDNTGKLTEALAVKLVSTDETALRSQAASQELDADDEINVAVKSDAETAVVIANTNDVQTLPDADATNNSDDTDAMVISPADIEKQVQTEAPIANEEDISRRIAWTNPLSALGTEISAQFEILQTGDNDDLLALFSHQASDTMVELEKIEAGTIIDQNQFPEFLENALSDIDIESSWIDFQFAGLQIFESSGVDKEVNVPVSIQAALHSAGGSPCVVIILMRGNNYTSDAAEFDRLRAAVWSTI